MPFWDWTFWINFCCKYILKDFIESNFYQKGQRNSFVIVETTQYASPASIFSIWKQRLSIMNLYQITFQKINKNTNLYKLFLFLKNKSQWTNLFISYANINLFTFFNLLNYFFNFNLLSKFKFVCLHLKIICIIKSFQ